MIFYLKIICLICLFCILVWPFADAQKQSAQSDSVILIGELTPYDVHESKDHEAWVSFIEMATQFRMDLKSRKSKMNLRLINHAIKAKKKVKVIVFYGTNEIAGIVKTNHSK